jgi:hypothetical protein
MAFEQFGPKIGLPAGADLSTHQYKFVKINSSGQVVLCAAAGEDADGVLCNKPVAGEIAEVQTISGGSIAMVMAGGAITRGSLVKTTAAAKAAAAVLGTTNTSDAGAASDPLVGSFVLGRSLETAAADGDIIAVLLKSMGAVPTTAA